MRKILSIFTTLLLLVTIVACGKVPEYFAEFNVTVDRESNLIGVDLEVIDPDEEVKGDIRITLKSLKDDKIQTKTTNMKQLKEDKENGKRIEFTSLVSGDKYELEIKTTIHEKFITVYKNTYETRVSSEVDIESVEDFLKIKDRRSATYNLKADLDFSEVDEDDINKGIITIFSGTFNGNNHTIKNYTLESSNINMGLFNQLSGDATVKDLNLENITIKQKGKATGSKRVGILFGQNTSRSTVVDNVTIKDSEIELLIDGKSDYQEVGFLGGASVAKISNINIDSTNKMVINQERVGNLKVGGLIGKIDNSSAEDVMIENIVTEGKIEYTITQMKYDEDKEEEKLNGIEDERVSLNIAGLAGQANNVNFKNVIVKTDILFNESVFVVEKLKDKQRRDTKIDIDVSGVISRNANVTLENLLYNGNITIEEIEVLNRLDEEEKLGYELNLHVAAIYAQTQTYNSNLTNVLRYNGVIEVFESEDKFVKIKEGSLFANYRNIEFNDKNLFGVNDESLKDNLDIKVFELKDLFAEDSFVFENFK